MEFTDISVSSGDGSAGGVSSGDAVLPVFPTVPEMVEDALEWYSPAPDVSGAEVSVSVPVSNDELALLQELNTTLFRALVALVVLCFFSGMYVGISLIKCFFIWRG